MNSGSIKISLEDKHLNSKESQQEKNITEDEKNQNKNINIENIEEPKENKIQPYYKLFIYSDSGTCIYKLKSKDIKNIINNNNDSFEEEDQDNEGVDKELGAIQGIIQAAYFTPLDIECEIHM